MTTFLITQLYVAYSAKNPTDPIADEMRGRLEAHEYKKKKTRKKRRAKQ